MPQPTAPVTTVSGDRLSVQIGAASGGAMLGSTSASGAIPAMLYRSVDGGRSFNGVALVTNGYPAPLYARLISAASNIHVDSGRRSVYVYAIVQPSTSTRVDVGLNLPGVEAGKRLEASGSFNAMVSHRVRIGKPAEVDKELIGWLRRAYDGA